MNKIISTLLFTSLGTFLSGGVVTLAMIANHQPLSAATLVLSITSQQIENIKNPDETPKFTVHASGNDCPHFFGENFPSCDIGRPFNESISKSIAKLDVEETGEWTVNDTAFPNLTDVETKFSVFGSTNPVTDEDKAGTWTYDPAEGDPTVRFWSVKAGTAFKLFWVVPESATLSGGACVGTNIFNINCLNQAVSVTEGDWNTPGNPAISHITFYNGKQEKKEVPEPSLILGLLSLGLMTFSKRSSKSKNCQK